MSTTANTANLEKYAPRYWPTWVGIGLMWSLTRLPYSWQIGIGHVIGSLLYRLAKRRRHIARVNLSLCFPELDKSQLELLLKQHFSSLGIGLMETAMTWWMPSNRLKNLVKVEGLENLYQALDRKKGVILLSGHFTTLEIGGRLLSLYTPFHAMYREHKNPVIESVMRDGRARSCGNVIDRRDLRAVLRALQQNNPIWYAPDQDYGIRHGIFVPFFGIPAATTTATSRIAAKSGAAVVPFFQVRLPRGRGYQLTLSPALENFPSGDAEADTRRVNKLFEQRIKENPSQYIWVHRRFKTRPAGEVSLYDSQNK
jgi:KDO2-lipid IV(A) lauroyltransferase